MPVPRWVGLCYLISYAAMPLFAGLLALGVDIDKTIRLAAAHHGFIGVSHSGCITGAICIMLVPLLIRYVGVVLNRHVPAGPIGCEASFGLAHPIHRGSAWHSSSLRSPFHLAGQSRSRSVCSHAGALHSLSGCPF